MLSLECPLRHASNLGQPGRKELTLCTTHSAQTHPAPGGLARHSQRPNSEAHPAAPSLLEEKSSVPHAQVRQRLHTG